MNTRSIDAAERRRRLAIRHRLSPDHPAGRRRRGGASLVCLHGTDQVTVFLSARARLVEMKVSDVEDALYSKRSLVTQIAMRRTLFVFPRTTLGLAQAGAANRVAQKERRTLVRDVENAGLHPDGERWLSETSRQVVDALSDGREATSSELRAEIPLLEGAIEYGQGKS